MTVDLPLELADGSGRRHRLESALREAIRSGRLDPGRTLPSTRALAADLGLARSTVVSAYEQLCAEGYLHAEHGSGTRVAEVSVRRDDADEVDLLGPTPTFDFRPGEPDASSFPRQAWMRSVRRIVTGAPDSVFGYPDPRGLLDLRGELATYLARTRSVEVAAASIRIVGGFVAGLGFIGDALRRSAVENVAVENPALPFHVDVLRLSGVTTVPIPVDDDGIVVEALDDADVGAVVVTPAHQYPTGATMSARRRAQLVAWARRGGAWIIEDDYDGEFRYDRRPIGALQGLAPDRVVYAGTVSKALAPTLRIGWLVVPEGFQAEMMRSIHVRAGVSGLEQLALADFVACGEFDRHIREMRQRDSARSVRLREVLHDTAPWLEPAPASAGLQLMARLRPDGPTEAAVITAAATASVGLMGLETDHGAKWTGPGLTIGFSRPGEHLYPSALERLGAVFAEL